MKRPAILLILLTLMLAQPLMAASPEFGKQMRSYSLCDVFVSMLQRLGVETDNFGSSTGTMKGLEG